MLKKIISLTLILALVFMLNITASAVSVSIDGSVFELQSVTIEGSILVPFRDVFEGLGAEITWDPVSRTGIAKVGDFRVVSAVGERFLIINGERRDMAVETQIIENKIFVPIRAAAEALNCTVTYDAATSAVVVEKGQLPMSLGDVFRGIISAKGWDGSHIAMQIGETVDINGVLCAVITAYSDSGVVGTFVVSYDFVYIYEVTENGYIPLPITR